jgi:predicted nucleotidyltransferase
MILQDLAKKGLIHPPKWLPNNTQYLAIVGSESYGANIGNSDRDLQGFCIPPKDDIFPHLRGEIPGFGNQHDRFNDWQQHHITDPSHRMEYDFCVYSIVKFFQLAMDNNPNILDIISVPTNCIVHITDVGQMVRDSRKIFYHAGCFHKFRGYAFKSMSKIESGANRSNPKRAADIEKNGYDTKFLMHCVRLALECEQLLLTGELDLQRDSQMLLSIRRGEWTFEQGKKWWEEKERALETAYTNCKALPHTPDEEKIKDLLLQCLEQYFGSLQSAIVRVPQLDTMIADLEYVVQKYKRIVT